MVNDNMSELMKREEPLEGELIEAMPKPRDPRARDEYMQALAMELSEQRLRDGTASSAEIVFWLKRSSPKEKMEMKNLELQNQLLAAKTEAINSERLGNELYEEAMRMFAGYAGKDPDENEE
jgi:hypothetical protein